MKKEIKSKNVGKYKNNQHYHQAFRIKLINDLVANQESMSFIERKHGIPADSLGNIKRLLLITVRDLIKGWRGKLLNKFMGLTTGSRI